MTTIESPLAGAVLLTQDGKTERQFVDSVEPYRVFPAEENDRVVQSVKDWLDGTEAASFASSKLSGGR